MKLFHHIDQSSDIESLQTGTNVLQEWTHQWLLKLNISKCKVVSFGRTADRSVLYRILDNNVNIYLDRVCQMKDLGFYFSERLVVLFLTFSKASMSPFL